MPDPVRHAKSVVPDRGHGHGKIQPQGLTAAAIRVETPEREGLRRVLQAWQPLALSYYDAIPEVHYAGNFYARAMENVRLFVGERDESGEIIESENEQAKELLARVHDPGGGRRLLLSRWGQLAFITGEGLLMWSAETDEDEERWEVVSTDELRPNGGQGYVRFRAPGLGGEEVRATPDGDWQPVPLTSIVYRLWTPHPRFSWMADAPMRGVLDICKELLVLTQAVNAMAVSHAARAGIFTVPEELDFPTPEGGMDDDPDMDPFEQVLNMALMAAIADPSSSAALAPIVLRGKAEFLHPDFLRHISISDEREKYPEENLRTECIRRLALGLDMPPEELLGKADVNMWTSFEITEDSWRHIEPIAWGFADSLSAVYLRPTARKESIEGWENICVGIDPSAAVVKPDKGTSANEVYDRGGLAAEFLLSAHDFSEDQRPSDEEFQTWLAVKLNDASLLPEKWQPQTVRVPASSEGDTAVTTTPPGEAEQSGASKGEMPDTKPESPGDIQDASQTASLDRMLGAAEMAVVRCREKAGAKAKAAAQGCAPCKTKLDGVNTDSVVATLGPETCGDLGLDVLALCAGGADAFVAQAVRWGWTPVQAQALGEMVETHAARNLFDPEVGGLPAGLAGHLRRGSVE